MGVRARARARVRARFRVRVRVRVRFRVRVRVKGYLVVAALYQGDAYERGEGLGTAVGVSDGLQHLERGGPTLTAIGERHTRRELLSRSRTQPQVASVGAQMGEVTLLTAAARMHQ